MLETTPSRPFGDSLRDLLKWQNDFRRRRNMVNDALGKDSALVTLPYYPRYGAEESTRAHSYLNPKTQNPVTWSSLVSDDSIASSARYRAVLGNIVQKRGKKVEIHVPLYKDVKTPSQKAGGGSDWEIAREGSIFMDSTLFGSTGCSLQVTMQARNIDEACRLHDGLIPLAPVLLATTAGTPVFRGLLAHTDTRWACFEQSVDDRTEEEIKAGRPSRSRVSASTTYTADSMGLPEEYQLQDLDYDEGICETLESSGMQGNLARHFAYILSCDPLYAPRQNLEEADVTDSTICESMLANMYQIIRLKPPTDENTRWRIEFRPMESQVSDFENAAFCVFVILAARLIIDRQLDLYVPLRDVETSMRNACGRDAATKSAFIFRSISVRAHKNGTRPAFLTADEIVNGSPREGGFEGMVPLIKEYVRGLPDLSEEKRQRLEGYLQFVADRASGEVPTTATWMRDFIEHHKEYRQDSLVSEQITYDLVRECIKKGFQDSPID